MDEVRTSTSSGGREEMCYPRAWKLAEVEIEFWEQEGGGPEQTGRYRDQMAAPVQIHCLHSRNLNSS